MILHIEIEDQGYPDTLYQNNSLDTKTYKLPLMQ